ncbi:MAG TPA: hypothetical protein PLU10_11090 [Chitinophagaceae bacterium]|nr:hypothetical protein [Chitinophagaceae bacterium]
MWNTDLLNMVFSTVTAISKGFNAMEHSSSIVSKYANDCVDFNHHQSDGNGKNGITKKQNAFELKFHLFM